MSRIFIDREKELNLLENKYNSNNFELIVIYGRRRIGKTRLIKEFIKDKPYIYFLCDKTGTKLNIQRFKKSISEFLKEPEVMLEDLEDIFRYLIKKYKKRLVIVFDEFSYLVEKDPSIPSIFQRVIDNVLQDSNIVLILCGSSISMMEKRVLSTKSPLYGRKTCHLKIKRLPFKSYFELYPKNDIKKNIEFFSVTGGVPFYMNIFKEEKSLYENVVSEIANRYGRLWEEVDFLLKTELREPDVYKKILEAIALGNRKLVHIAHRIAIEPNKVSKYLLILENLQIVKKEYPITENKLKTKKSLYYIDDNFIDFYMGFVEPFKEDLEFETFDNFTNNFKNRINLFISKKFEKLVREELVKMLFKNFNKIGTYWDKNVEIDILALNEQKKELLAVECKWKENVDPYKVCKSLVDKLGYVTWNKECRKEYLCIFAKSFKKKISEFKGYKVFCYDLKDISNFIFKF